MKRRSDIKILLLPSDSYKGGIPGQVSATQEGGWGEGERGRAGQTEDNHQGDLTLTDGHSWR